MQCVVAGWAQDSVAEPQLLREVAIAELEFLSKQRAGHRPDRVEPRAVKRRPKPHKLLTKPRQEARDELLGICS